jgi:hypothetical protein
MFGLAQEKLRLRRCDSDITLTFTETSPGLVPVCAMSDWDSIQSPTRVLVCRKSKARKQSRVRSGDQYVTAGIRRPGGGNFRRKLQAAGCEMPRQGMLLSARGGGARTIVYCGAVRQTNPARIASGGATWNPR